MLADMDGPFDQSICAVASLEVQGIARSIDFMQRVYTNLR